MLRSWNHLKDRPARSTPVYPPEMEDTLRRNKMIIIIIIILMIGAIYIGCKIADNITYWYQEGLRGISPVFRYRDVPTPYFFLFRRLALVRRSASTLSALLQLNIVASKRQRLSVAPWRSNVRSIFCTLHSYYKCRSQRLSAWFAKCRARALGAWIAKCRALSA